MFNNSKYTKWYFSIIQNAKSKNRKKSKDIYLESHHILPLSLEGSNKIENKVLLTFKEHYLCHTLLVKMVTNSKDKIKMNYALYMFNRKNDHQERTLTPYQIKKCLEANRKASSSRNHKPFGGKTHKPETIEKQRIASTGAKHTTETIEKIKLNNEKTNESRSKKVKEFQAGRIKSQSHRNNLSLAAKQNWIKRKMVASENYDISTSSV